jgi:hypothetical protein
MNSLDIIANWLRFHRGVTVALQIKLVRVTSPDNIANGVRVQKGGDCCVKKIGSYSDPP